MNYHVCMTLSIVTIIVNRDQIMNIELFATLIR